jgi:two-component system, chemotaxis family, sensor kinase CheA
MQNQSVALKSRQLNILLVDDSEVLRQAYRRVLEGWGHKVDVAEDGLEAMEFLKKTMYQLVVTDYEMPRCNGFEFLGRAREEFDRKAAIPFVLMTAAPLESLSGQLDGFAFVLKKPFDILVLSEVLRKLFPGFC